MNATQNLRIHDYNYLLPDERIAKYPLDERDHSKLLLRNSHGAITEDRFEHLPDYLPAGALMVFNNTKVIRARLHFHKSTGALIEIFCLEPHTPLDYQLSFAAMGSVTWTCLVGNLKKWKSGTLERRLTVGGRTLFLTAERVGESGTGFDVHFAWDLADVSWSEVLEAMGELPIPPYLNRATEERDLTTYQTVYSKVKGSVAAPTAGLHFTDRVLRALDAKGIERNELTLHVGAGTFKPVKTTYISDHTMHSEWIAVPRLTIERLLAHDCRCIAVGTTSVRTLESLYYIGVRLHETRTAGATPTDEVLSVPQWFPYDYADRMATKGSTELPTAEALQEILDYLDREGLTTLHTATRIIIAPGYDYKIVKTIITNFHQPQSTLLLLVSAFVGGAWRPIYDYALDHGFRFLSYGDSSLLNYDTL